MSDEINERELFSWLPEQIGSFRLDFDTIPEEGEQKRHYYFQYVNDKGERLQALYDGLVEDYTVHIKLALFDFVEISFIRTSLDSFVEVLKKRLEKELYNLLVEPAENFIYGYVKSGAPSWDFSEALPETVGDFKRLISPDRAVRALNGSYIIAMYKKEQENTGLILFYNVLRNEFFSELRVKSYPKVTHLLDSKSVMQLEGLLKERLEGLLTSCEENSGD